MIKRTISSILVIVISFFFISVKQTFAAPCVSPPGYTCIGDCTSLNQCSSNNKRCIEIAPLQIAANGPACGSSIVGGINPPQGVGVYNCDTGNCNNIGIFSFISVALRLFTVLCGLFMFFNNVYKY